MYQPFDDISNGGIMSGGDALNFGFCVGANPQVKAGCAPAFVGCDLALGHY